MTKAKPKAPPPDTDQDALPADEAELLDDDATPAPRPYTEDDVTQDSAS